MAILTIQIPDTEVTTLSTIVERIAGSILKVNADEDIYTNDCLQKEDDHFIKTNWLHHSLLTTSGTIKTAALLMMLKLKAEGGKLKA
jgi:plastocyanin domain-containing protein